MGAHDPATGKRAGRFVEVPFAKAEAGEDLFRLRLTLVVEMVVRRVEVMGGRVAEGQLQDRFFPSRSRLLRQEAKVGAAFPRQRAFVGRFLAENEPEEGRLAGAVGAD